MIRENLCKKMGLKSDFYLLIRIFILIHIKSVVSAAARTTDLSYQRIPFRMNNQEN